VLARLHAQLAGAPAWSLAQARERLAAAHPSYQPLRDLAAGATFFAGGERLFQERFETADGRARFSAGAPRPGPAPRRARDYTAVEDWFQRLQRRSLAGAQRAR
jgi:hypothetical protein